MTSKQRRTQAPTGPLRLLLDVRNSTLFQVGNYSAQEQVDAMVLIAEQRHPGSTVVLVDEQGTSGADMSKRHAFLEAQQEIKLGTAHGIVVYDIKRLTRDPFGIDGGHLAELLSDNHAILVTFTRDYNLRMPADLMAFQFECMLAGIDWRGIRDTFWRGMFKKMDTDAVVRRPPLGYMTVREWGNRPGTTRKYVAKNPEHAHAMDGIRQAFDTCRSIQQCCLWLTDHGYPRPSWKFRDKDEDDGSVTAGKVVDYWTPRLLKYVLSTNELYTGTFVFGRDGNRESPVWEATGRHAAGEIRTEVPALAYWTLSDAARWRRKFVKSYQGNSTHSRERIHAHPLTGVLNCAECGRPMVGAGKLGYRCQGTTTAQCDQWISNAMLLRVLRPLLPGLLAEVEGLADEWGRANSGHVETQAERELAAVEQRASSIRKLLLMLAEPDVEVAAELDGLNRRVKILRVQAAEQKAEAASLRDTTALIASIQYAPHAFDDPQAMTDDQRAAVYAKLLKDVRLKGSGVRGGRRYEIVLAESRLAIHVSDDSCPRYASYASTLGDLVSLLASCA